MLYPTMWLRGHTYWLRRVVPLDLRERLGGLTEIRRSLRTRDPEEAKRRWKIESIKVDRMFEDARRGVVQPTALRRITEDERDYYVDQLVADDQGDKRLSDPVRRRYMAYPPAALVVLRQLEVEALAVHPGRDAPNAGPGVEPGPKRPERAVVRRAWESGESERCPEELAALVEHAPYSMT